MVSAAGLARRASRPVRPLLDRAVGSVCGVRTEAPVVVMTYDDGPEPGTTPAVLAALAERDARATFFVLVGRAEREPTLLREVMAAGHEIGLHGIDHRRLTAFPAGEVARRTREGRDRLEQLTQTSLRWFRPPYGGQSPSTWRAVRTTGLHPVLWGPTLLDWTDAADDERVEAGLAGVGPGAVVLAHDGFADQADGVYDGPRPQFDRGALTRRVLQAYADRGLAACSLGGALAEGTAARRVWFQG